MATKETKPAKASAITEASTITETAHLVPWDRFVPNKWNKRHFAKDGMQDPRVLNLVGSLERTGGNSQAVLARPLADGTLEIVYGECRVRATKLSSTTPDANAHWRNGNQAVNLVKVVIRDMTDEEVFQLMLDENKARTSLHPLEEADTLLAYIEEKGWTVDQAATEMGISRQTAARRMQLAKLTDKWKAAMENPEHPASKWSVAHFERIAALPTLQQDKVFASFWTGYGNERHALMTLEELRRNLSSQFNTLDSVPWKLDDDTFKGCPACNVCQMRSGVNPDLFDAADFGEKEGKAKASDRCLNASCYNLKLDEALARKLPAYREKYPGLVLLTDYNSDLKATPFASEKVVKSDYSMTGAKKSDPGAFPCLILRGSGRGTIQWKKKYSYDSSGGGSTAGKVPGQPKSLAMRRAELGKARRKLVYSYLIEDVQNWLTKGPLPTMTCGSLAFVHAFGTHQNGVSTYNHEIDNIWRFAEKLGAIKDDELTEHLVISALQNVITRFRAQINGNTLSEDTYKKELPGFCQIFDLSAKEYEARAAEQRPEPKGWTNLNADGTPKAVKLVTSKTKADQDTELVKAPRAKGKTAKAKPAPSMSEDEGEEEYVDE